eukprot:Gregarina_sp_Poly_1__10692@NODE_80_length_15637_cov_125_963134_g68_i0_p13_GENE_NODE_80_length_15637_cov_125_963134_g68_i0NODE_80_length_15637_cov_125_963134_g68_i0_p13_ORF_typecomplete_len153_score20_67DNA_pol_E_B/PF04042_16/2_3e08_NODE_80_length_15637_cov_125_963134_g68_i037054163
MGNFCRALCPNVNDISRVEHYTLPSASCWMLKRYHKIEQYAQVWSCLFEILKLSPRLLESGCQICIIPGPFDPGLPIIPRPPLTPELTSYLHEEISNVYSKSQINLSGNPLRYDNSSGFKRSLFAIALINVVAPWLYYDRICFRSYMMKIKL